MRFVIVNAERVAARRSTAKCKTCGRPVTEPTRLLDGSTVVAGCIAADHTGHINDAWHNSEAAQRARILRTAAERGCKTP